MIAVALLLMAAAPPAATGLCAPGETILFQCRVCTGGSARIAAVCLTPAGAEYRYGRPERVELAAGGVVVADRPYAGGGERQFIAVRDEWRYVLFDTVMRTAFGPDGRHDPAISSGLVVQKRGRTVATRLCTDEPERAGVATDLPRGEAVAR